MRIYLDTNVILDALIKRGNSHSSCQEILRLVYEKRMEAGISAAALLNAFYFLKKSGMEKTAFIQVAKLLVKYLMIIPNQKESILAALESGFPDVEDAVQYFSVVQTEAADYFITSNLRHFKKADRVLPVLSPEAFLNVLSMTGNE